MIKLDENVLEKVLFEVLQQGYRYSNKLYLVIEEIEFYVEDIDSSYSDSTCSPNFSYNVRGRYGMEDSWQRSINMNLETDWSWDFIAGYFKRQLDFDDLEGSK